MRLRWTLVLACFVLASCSQERQSRIDTLRSSPTEAGADYSARPVSPATQHQAPTVTRSMSAASTTDLRAPLSSETPSSRVAAPEVSDQEITRQLIANSLAAYPGSCPCPYNLDRAGRRCGGRSAYSRPGGYAPLCFENDVTVDLIQNYRRKLVTASR
jgi:hypothetical protein